MRRCHWLIGIALSVLITLCASTSAQITFGQIDDFQTTGDVLTLGWTRGVNAIQLPFVVSTGGPKGTDAFLENNSTGTSGSNSRMSMFNQSQWTGNYVAAGVTLITAEMADFGSTPLYMRIAIEDHIGTQYGSTNAAFLPADGLWHPVSFDLTTSAMTLLQGTNPLSQALTTVGILRLVSNQEGPNFRGDVLLGLMGIDDFAAVPEPSLLLLLSGLAITYRRRASPHLGFLG